MNSKDSQKTIKKSPKKVEGKQMPEDELPLVFYKIGRIICGRNAAICEILIGIENPK